MTSVSGRKIDRKESCWQDRKENSNGALINRKESCWQDNFEDACSLFGLRSLYLPICISRNSGISDAMNIYSIPLMEQISANCTKTIRARKRVDQIISKYVENLPIHAKVAIKWKLNTFIVPTFLTAFIIGICFKRPAVPTADITASDFPQYCNQLWNNLQCDPTRS